MAGMKLPDALDVTAERPIAAAPAKPTAPAADNPKKPEKPEQA